MNLIGKIIIKNDNYLLLIRKYTLKKRQNEMNKKAVKVLKKYKTKKLNKRLKIRLNLF